MSPKAILFDLDDTILVEDKAAELAWDKACRISAKKIALFDSEELFKRINHIRKLYWNDVKRTSTEDKGRVDFFYARMIIVKSALNELGCNQNDIIATEIVQNYSSLKLELTEFVPECRKHSSRIKK